MKDLESLLRNMEPRLNEGRYTFAAGGDATRAVGWFREDEGTTLILPDEAGAWAWITLTVCSDLNAVGFLAAITERLAAAGIPVNAVSAFYHDHLFVPWEARERAMEVLEGMSGRRRLG